LFTFIFIVRELESLFQKTEWSASKRVLGRSFTVVKNKEWKIKTQQTAHMIKTNKKILGEFGPKRFPKKKEEN